MNMTRKKWKGIFWNDFFLLFYRNSLQNMSVKNFFKNIYWKLAVNPSGPEFNLLWKVFLCFNFSDS